MRNAGRIAVDKTSSEDVKRGLYYVI